MKILILGSCGFIGSHLVDYYVNKNHAVVGCDLMEHAADQYQYRKLSVLSSDFDALLLQHQFDCCINASGSGNVSFSLNQPLSDFESNALVVAKVLETIKRTQPSCKFIQISSAAVYGNPDKLPVSETDAIHPLSPYGYHKWMSEIICKEYSDLFNLNIAVLRPFSVYGNGLKKQLFWDICQKLKKNSAVSLSGTGSETRDFIHISDLAALTDEIISKGEFCGEVYNAATGVQTSIQQIASLFAEIFPEAEEISFTGNSRAGDPLNWQADISKITRLGYTAKTSLSEGVKDYINWYLKHMHEG